MLDPLSEAERLLDDAGLLHSSGSVLYSSSHTLRPGPVYVLGLNPGGAEGATLLDSLKGSRAGHNAYLDEQWITKGRLQPIGQATLQRRVQNLFSVMGLPVRDVPASNLAFTRSTRTGKHLNFNGAISLCLPVHRVFIEAIKPSFLMTFGAMGNFGRAFKIRKMVGRSADHGTWRAYRGVAELDGRSFSFGNVPHMSVWASDKRAAVVQWALEGMQLPI